MRVVVQRVSSASVQVENNVIGAIDIGLLLFCGIEESDDDEDIIWLANKITALRIFSDENGLMNLSLNDVKGSLLVISQFTLHAMTKKGNRPSFIRAAKPFHAIPVFEKFCQSLSNKGVNVQKGIFGADMKVSLVNDGPVTIILDSKNRE